MPENLQFNDQDGGLTPGFEANEPKPPLNQLDKNQKIAAASLAVFAVLIVVLWSVQLKNNIYGPLNGSGKASDAVSAELADNQAAQDQALKNKDTDADTLSDYDELYLYKTSPYLADSDSDGIKDGEELKKGTDPNCPIGRTCFSSGAIGAASSTPPIAGDDVLNSMLNPSATDAGAEVSAGLTQEQIQILKQMSASDLRQLLLETGMSQAELDKISDQELMKSYSEMLK